MRVAKKIWSDPVWSKVIASSIMGLCVYLGVLLFPSFESLLSTSFGIISGDLFILATVILTLVVVVLIQQRHRGLSAGKQLEGLGKEFKQKKGSALEWLRSLTDKELNQYLFLLWFPLRHTLITPKYFMHSEEIHHVPEISDLIERGVIRMRMESSSQYAVYLDKEVYRYLEREFIHNPTSLSEKDKEILERMKHTEFFMMFRRRNLFGF
jgi:hypothetical protein